MVQTQMLDHSRPVLGSGRLGNQLQVTDVLADRPAELVSEHQPGERPTLTLPRLRERLEADILREQHPPERGNPVQ
jgi:hypothetical protein